MYRKTCRIAALAATLAAIGAMSVAAAPASAFTPCTAEEAMKGECLPITPTFNNWTVTGSLKIKKLENQTVNLPAGSTFSGKGVLALRKTGISGEITGHTAIPPFSAPLTVFGIPTVVGLTFTEVGSVEGKVSSTNPALCGGNPTCVNLSVPFKANMGITSVTIFGLKIPTQCQTVTPVSFPLSTNLTLLEIVAVGSHFEGTTTLPNIKCSGLFGGILGPVLSFLMSGPENAYSFNINPPK